MTSVSDWDGKPRGDTAYSEIERERMEEGEKDSRVGGDWPYDIRTAYYTRQDLSCAFHMPGNFVDWKKETALHFFIVV